MVIDVRIYFQKAPPANPRICWILRTLYIGENIENGNKSQGSIK